MCGIVGKVNFDPEQPVDAHQVRRMTDSLRHRGPDDSGIWTNGNVGLGHRRLSIIDLSPNGRNPMCNEDETVWIVFNGEIYNFQELRPGLEAAGHGFKSRTDTEVILHLYEELGPMCVKELRGMFAFAIWDSRSRTLLLARDRMGVKPLHYSVTRSGLLFGSEIKALLAAGDIDAEPDLGSLHQFLLWQCIPSPRTGFREISKLPPASILTWQPGKDVSIQKYWVPDYSDPIPAAANEVAEQVRSLVQEATRLRLIADVPVGIFLSGGIDSACVLAAARKANAGKIQTFSVTFGHDDFDESKYARLLASHFETEHHEFHVTPKVMDLLPEMADLFDEPFADPAAIPTYYLSQLTREHVKVALGGDGGDEAFAGYQRYLALKVLGWLSRIPGAAMLGSLRALLPYSAGERSKRRYIKEILLLLDRTPVQQYRAMLLGMRDEEQWHSFYTDEFREALNGSAGAPGFLQGWDLPSVPNDLAGATASDTLGYIPECLNVKVDIASMACGLEVRSPFLDHKLVEFSARIPSRLKIKGLRQKHILKHAFRKELPEVILKRGKAGFGMPLATWLRGELRGSTEETLLAHDSCIRGFLRPDQIRIMLSEHAAGKRNWHVQLWRLLVLENWLKANTARARTRASNATQSDSSEVMSCTSFANGGPALKHASQLST
ncbi:MAG TPA: asparagine synthase (glutamine-hydrolyzing) [Candidatus Dormibacteraeota bacterium]|nr:asparagine synthase (glutamine-hydrolyzing) [Candidatus Dormibacteraeota bacterium]